MTKKDLYWLLVIVVCVLLTAWLYVMNKNIVKEQAEMDAFIEKIEKFNEKLKAVTPDDIAKYKAATKSENGVAKPDKKD